MVLFTVRKNCESKLCCLRHRRRLLPFIYSISHRLGHPINENLKHFIAAHNTRALAALGELVLVIPHCRTDHFSWFFLPAAVRP